MCLGEYGLFFQSGRFQGYKKILKKSVCSYSESWGVKQFGKQDMQRRYKPRALGEEIASRRLLALVLLALLCRLVVGEYSWPANCIH